MQRFFLIFSMLFASFLYGVEGIVTPELLTLLEHFQLKHDGNLPSIVEVTQRAWLRPHGKERWEADDHFSGEDREAVLTYYLQTGKLNDKRPLKKVYQAGAICGSTTDSMKNRIHFLEQLVKGGLQVREIVLLSGSRALDPKIDRLLEGCMTEGDAFMALWKVSDLYSKNVWKHLDHPMIALENGSYRRPNTYDTFLLWQQTNPQGPVLIITDQPYCCYFEAVAQWAFPRGFEYEVVGKGVSPESQTTSILLDNLARWIYVTSKH
ncbi:MAG: hypothetical protein KBA81_02225 [Rhabdochlamydiaceae bacterium]|nr:hypothetical protein [Rhabdochlamydiaceae bacterium]